MKQIRFTLSYYNRDEIWHGQIILSVEKRE